MSSDPQAPLRIILNIRHRLFGFRLVIAGAIGACYGSLIGWQLVAYWLGACVCLQSIEHRCFGGRKALIRTLDRRGEAFALALIFLNSTAFASLSIIDVLRLGPWGVTCAAFLLTGSMLNAVLTTMGSLRAFVTSLVPFAIFLLILTGMMLRMPGLPSPVIALGCGLGGILLTAGAVQLWAVWTKANRAEAAAISRDIAERAANEERLFRLAHTDSLTGLANRTAMQAHLRDLADGNAPAALLLTDLDGFKYVNDTMGHSAGDAVLKDVAARLTAAARPSDVIVRLGGDEFALLLPGVGDAGHARIYADRIIASVAQPFSYDGQAVTISASVGIALYPFDGADGERLLASADLALYQAKGEGRHCSRMFTPHLRENAISKLSRDSELSRALANGEFEVFYQPEISLRTGALSGAEALLRWQHPQRGLLAPSEFLPSLENGRLAAPVGEWVLETACRQAAQWRKIAPDFRIGVNLFGSQFRSGDLARKVTGVLFAEDLPPDALELEITENIILRHEDDLVAPLRRLRDLGVGIAFDDYGTGYASLSLLKRYPLSRLKIDRMFVQTVCNSPADATIVRAIISMAEAFNLGVIAEGVETRSQADRLRQYGCEEAQGFLYGKPQSADALARRYLARPEDENSDRKILRVGV